MRYSTIAMGIALLTGPGLAHAQGTTQSRDGLGDASHPTEPTNAAPAGSENATSGPQSRPAYPSGSTTANPGAAFVRTQPVPSTPALASPPGDISTTTVTGNSSVKQPQANAVGGEGAAPAPPSR